MAGGINDQGKKSDKWHMILWGRRRRHPFKCKMRVTKKKMQKGQRGVWIEPKVKALYAKGGG